MRSVIIVDFQKDFTRPFGKAFVPRPCVPFIQNTIIPTIQRDGWRLFSIVSDYRLPRPGDEHELCVPGTEGFQEDIYPDGLKLMRHPSRRWVKAMNSPTWIRENGGAMGFPTYEPYPDPDKFIDWCDGSFTPRESIALIGLTVDCCVLCTAMELSYQGYHPVVVSDATDAYDGTKETKDTALRVISNWAEVKTSKQVFG